jgi:hypothetical protein
MPEDGSRSAADRRRDYDRFRVSAEFALPLDRIEGSTYDAMRVNAMTTLKAFNRRA